MPASATTARGVLVIFTADSAPTVTTASSGWTRLDGVNGATMGSTVFYKRPGVTLTTPTLSLSFAEEGTYIVLAFDGAEPTEDATLTGLAQSGANTNPPSHTPAGGARDYLWVAVRSGEAAVVATAAPASFSNLTSATGGASGASTSTAERQLNAASLDPGTFTSATEDCVGWTIAIPPVADTALIVTTTPGDQVTDGAPPTLTRMVALTAADQATEPVPVSVAQVHAVPPGEVVVEGLSVSATVRNTDLAISDMVVESVPVAAAYRVAGPVGEQVADPLPVGVARAAVVPAADVTAESVPVGVTRVVHLPVGDVATEPVPVAVVRVVALPVADQVVDGFILTLSSALAPGDVVVVGLPVTVAYGAEVSASRRGLPPVIFLPTTRVIAQNILTGEFLHWELPVRDLEITWVLSGPTVISGSFEPEIQDLIGLDLQAHGTWLHIEDSGLIRASGILQPTRADDQKLSVEALGVSAYAASIPYRGVYSQIGVDPAAVVQHLWSHIQSYPRGNLGVQVHGTTPVRLGTEPAEQVDFVTGGGEQVSFDRGGPYKLDWFTNRLIGAEIDDLAGETPFDYVERANWNADKTDVEHHIDIAYPSIGRRRTDLRFADGENILESAPIEEPDGVYADEVIVQGSGEGQSAITGRAALPVPSRLRMPVVVVDKNITSTDRANARAAEELSARLAAMVEVAEIAIQARHPNAPLGSFSVGDEIQPHLVLPHIGAISPWSRITGIRYLAESDAAVLALTRRGEFASR